MEKKRQKSQVNAHTNYADDSGASEKTTIYRCCCYYFLRSYYYYYAETRWYFFSLQQQATEAVCLVIAVRFIPNGMWNRTMQTEKNKHNTQTVNKKYRTISPAMLPCEFAGMKSSNVKETSLYACVFRLKYPWNTLTLTRPIDRALSLSRALHYSDEENENRMCSSFAL